MERFYWPSYGSRMIDYAELTRQRIVDDFV